MDFLNSAFAQLKDLFQSMTPGARITAGLLLALVVISLGYLVTHQVSGSNAFLMGGEIFSRRDLPQMEAAFAKAGLEGYEIEGGRVRIPRGQQNPYMAALAEAGALPHNFGDIMQKALDGGSVFESKDQRNQRIKIATQRELSLIIGSMNGIDRAMVLWDTETKTGFRQETVATASVNVQPEGTMKLDESRVPAIRHLVAGAIAGLKPDDVVVTDLGSGCIFRGGSDGIPGAMDDPLVARKSFYEKMFKENILNALALVPGAIVTCNVELDPQQVHREEAISHDPKTVPFEVTDSTTSLTREPGASGGPVGARSQANSSVSLNVARTQGTRENEEQTDRHEINAVASTREETVMAIHPIQRVTAVVGVPDSYFKRVWQGQNPPEEGAEPKTPDPAELDQIRSQEVAKIKSHVAGLLPKPVGVVDSSDLVTVDVFRDLQTAAIPAPDMGQAAVTWLGQYWSLLGLLVLAFFSLIMLRSMVRSVSVASVETGQLSVHHAENEGQVSLADETEREPVTKRFNTSGESLKDELSELVNGDPDTAASILRTWIGSTT